MTQQELDTCVQKLHRAEEQRAVFHALYDQALAREAVLREALDMTWKVFGGTEHHRDDCPDDTPVGPAAKRFQKINTTITAALTETVSVEP